MRKKWKFALAFAVAAALIVAGVAFATGWVQSIFSIMGEPSIGGRQTKDFAVMEKMAQNQVAKTSMALAEGATPFEFEVSQVYYDGAQLLLATAWKEGSDDADLSFGPGSAHFDDLIPMTQRDSVPPMSPEGMVSPETWAAFMDLYKRNGAAGMVFYMSFPGDGPENGFYHFGELESKPFTFTVENNHGTSRAFYASTSSDTYSADVMMVLTPVGVTAWISTVTSDEWKDAMIKDEHGEARVSGVDYVLEYNAYVDSVPQPGWLDEAGASLRGSFMVPVGAQKIAFRPVYSLSGEHPEEDIAFSLK